MSGVTLCACMQGLTSPNKLCKAHCHAPGRVVRTFLALSVCLVCCLQTGLLALFVLCVCVRALWLHVWSWRQDMTLCGGAGASRAGPPRMQAAGASLAAPAVGLHVVS